MYAKYWNFLRLTYLNLSLTHRVQYDFTPKYFLWLLLNWRELHCSTHGSVIKLRLTTLHTIIKAISILLICIIDNLLISSIKIKLLKIYWSGFWIDSIYYINYGTLQFSTSMIWIKSSILCVAYVSMNKTTALKIGFNFKNKYIIVCVYNHT